MFASKSLHGVLIRYNRIGIAAVEKFQIAVGRRINRSENKTFVASACNCAAELNNGPVPRKGAAGTAPKEALAFLAKRIFRLSQSRSSSARSLLLALSGKA